MWHLEAPNVLKFGAKTVSSRVFGVLTVLDNLGGNITYVAEEQKTKSPILKDMFIVVRRLVYKNP